MREDDVLPNLKMRGLGKEIWAGTDTDEYCPGSPLNWYGTNAARSEKHFWDTTCYIPMARQPTFGEPSTHYAAACCAANRVPPSRRAERSSGEETAHTGKPLVDAIEPIGGSAFDRLAVRLCGGLCLRAYSSG